MVKMREDVGIILNERESTKLKVVQALQRQLSEKGITVSRIEITPNVNQVVLERLPRILVLDYLLGDYSTGLDILSALQEIPIDSRPKVIFLTDEPSVRVAIEAIKGGSLDYFEIDNPQSMSQVIKLVSSILVEQRKSKQTFADRRETVTLADLVASSASSIALVAHAKVAVKKYSPIIVICGPRGSGRSTLAHAIHLERRQSIYFKSIDIDSYDQEIRDLVFPKSKSGQLYLGSSLDLFVDHVEHDLGELLDLVSKNFSRIWKGSPSEFESFLVLGTSSISTAQAWRKLAPASELLEIQPLHKRPEDIQSFIHRFVQDAQKLSGLKLKPIESKVVLELTRWEWPGEVKQLKSVIIDSVIRHFLFEGKGEIFEIIKENYSRWIEQNALAESDMAHDPLVCAAVLEDSGHNYRIAAARLGYPVAKLKETLNTLRQ